MKKCILVAGTLALGASKASAYDPSSVWDWKVRPAVGARYMLRTYTRSETESQVSSGTASAKPQTISITTVQNVTYDHEVLSRDALGASTIKLTYRSFNTTTSMRGPGLDSKVPNLKSTLKKSISAIDKAYLGAILTLKVAPDGKVWSIVGLEKLRARLAKAFNEQYGAMFGASIGSPNLAKEETYKASFAQIYSGLPLHPVAAGDSWPYALAVPSSLGIRGPVQATRQLVERRDGVATVKESSIFDVSEEMALPQPVEGASPSTVQMEGNWKNALSVDEASGLMRESNSSLVFKGRSSVQLGSATAIASAITVITSGRIVAHTVLEPVS